MQLKTGHLRISIYVKVHRARDEKKEKKKKKKVGCI